MTQAGAGHQKCQPCDNESRAMGQPNNGERKLEAATSHNLVLNHPAITIPQERLGTLCSVEHRVGEHVHRTQEGDTP